ncbi:MAG: hypothetical protein R3E01_14120 [Pirellulaceae bacterium]
MTWKLGRGVFTPLGRMTTIVVSAVDASATLCWLNRASVRFAFEINRVATWGHRWNLDRWLSPLRIVIRPLLMPLNSVAIFLDAWFRTRNYRDLLWGVPALVMLVPLGVCGFNVAMIGEAELVARYRRAMKREMEAGDYERVQLLGRRLQRLGEDVEYTRYQAALRLPDDRGGTERAYAIMSEMAPSNALGFIPAHVWIVQRLIAGTIPSFSDDDRWSMAQKHVDLIRQWNRDHDDDDRLAVMQAYVYAGQQRWKEAANELQAVESKKDGTYLDLFRMYVSGGQADEARDAARKVIRICNERAVGEERDFTSNEYVLWAAAYQVDQDLLASQRVLEEARDKLPDDRIVAVSLRGVYVTRLRQILESMNTSPSVAVELVVRLNELSTSEEVDALAAEMYGLGKRSDNVAWRTIVALAEDNRTSGQFLQSLGSHAALDGEFELARIWLGRAVERDPHSHVALNNLAWVLANCEPYDLQKSILLSNHAIELVPDAYRYRETRGQTYVRLKLWNEAIADLEFALNGMPEDKNIHAALATAYDAVGKPALAKAHREAVK